MRSEVERSMICYYQKEQKGTVQDLNHANEITIQECKPSQEK